MTCPANTVDELVDQLQVTVTSILDEVAPMRRGKRAHGRKSARWLSPEAIAAKQLRRRLERRWKKTKAEADRAVYRTACRKANQLINASRNLIFTTG